MAGGPPPSPRLLSRPEETVSGPQSWRHCTRKSRSAPSAVLPPAVWALSRDAVLSAAVSWWLVTGQSEEQGGNPEILFGPDEDIMLWKMMEAIALRPEEVYVTNILKCCPGVGQVADQECRESCFSYLVREIVAVRPQLICAMGDLAVRMLVGGTGAAFPPARAVRPVPLSVNGSHPGHADVPSPLPSCQSGNEKGDLERPAGDQTTS